MTRAEAVQQSIELGQLHRHEYSKVVAEPVDPSKPAGAWHVVGRDMADHTIETVLAG